MPRCSAPADGAMQKRLSKRRCRSVPILDSRYTGLRLANEQLGDRQVASKAYADFLTAWKDV